MGGFSENCYIDVDDPATTLANPPGCIFEENMRRGAFPFGIARWEMLTDVSVADGAQKRVGQRMQNNVGVGVPFKFGVVRYFHAAEPNMIPISEAMHIVAGRRAGFSPFTECALCFLVGRREIIGRSQFDIIRIALDQPDFKPCPLGESCIIGEIVLALANCIAMRP